LGPLAEIAPNPGSQIAAFYTRNLEKNESEQIERVAGSEVPEEASGSTRRLFDSIEMSVIPSSIYPYPLWPKVGADVSC
jgi:hypothetical protein